MTIPALDSRRFMEELAPLVEISRELEKLRGLDDLAQALHPLLFGKESFEQIANGGVAVLEGRCEGRLAERRRAARLAVSGEECRAAGVGQQFVEHAGPVDGPLL